MMWNFFFVSDKYLTANHFKQKKAGVEFNATASFIKQIILSPSLFHCEN